MLTILLLMSFEYGHMQHRLNMMERNMKVMKDKENSLNSQLRFLRSDVRGVRRDERKLEGKERALERDVKDEKKTIDKLKSKDAAWGSDNDRHEIKMNPLIPHHSPFGFGPFGHMGGLGGLLEGLRNRVQSMHSSPMDEGEHIFRLPHLSIFHPPVEIEEEPEESSTVEITIEEPKHDEEKKADKKDVKKEDKPTSKMTKPNENKTAKK